MDTITFLRQYHLGNYAIFDLVLAFLGMYILAPLLSKLSRKLGFVVPARSWLFLTLPISILAHFAVGNMTAMTRDFFDPQGHYILKTIIFLSLVMGMRNIKKIKA